jgi:hypothetical protein
MWMVGIKVLCFDIMVVVVWVVMEASRFVVHLMEPCYDNVDLSVNSTWQPQHSDVYFVMMRGASHLIIHFGGITSCPLTPFFLQKLSNSLQSVRTQWCAEPHKLSLLFIWATILIHKGSNLWRPTLGCHTIHFGAQIYEAPYKKYLTLHFGAQIYEAPYKKYLTLHFGAQTCEAPTCAGCYTLHFILYYVMEANQSTHQLLEMNLKSKPFPNPKLWRWLEPTACRTQ